MKLYKTKNGIIIERDNIFYQIKDKDWDSFINDDNLYNKMIGITDKHNPIDNAEKILKDLEAPIHSQELWAAGVTYLKSKEERQEESKDAGGGDFYARVYAAERPELFFKGSLHRIQPGMFLNRN
jgi:2-dehydro-3-deoxy-D-arabinonate dehydratase